MDSEEAFAILGLPEECSEDEITARYRELAASLHPDRGGDAGRMQELNRARDVARAHVRASRSLTTTRETGVVVPRSASDVLRLYSISQAPERVAAAARRRTQDLLEEARRQLYLVGGVGAAALFFAKDILPEVLGRLAPAFLDKDVVLGTLLLIGAIGGTGFWWLSERLRRFEREVERFSRSLVRVDLFSAVFRSIYSEHKLLTYSHLLEGIARWLAKYWNGDRKDGAGNPQPATPLSAESMHALDAARRIGLALDEEHLALLLVARGLENGALQREHLRHNDTLTECFRFVGAAREANPSFKRDA